VIASQKYQLFNHFYKMSGLPPATQDTIKGLIDAACSTENGLPGASVAIVGKDGKLLVSHAGGQRGHVSPEPLTTDSVFWIASCTKLITGIACMQLVEQGRISLDDANETERICPELKDLKVLQDDGTLVDKKRGITLRMLLSHTGQ
jgi:CubicO group peptidase (beta-lactamase class C family)